jgi:uncharacterized protein (TIGR02598 family)
MAFSRKSPGFSLIEVMIAVVIFSFGMLALVGLQYSSINMTSTSNNRFAAINLVQQVIERARADGKGRFNPSSFEGTYNQLGKPATGESTRVFTRTVAVNGNILVVQVNWNEHTEVKHVTSSSFFY